VTIHPKAQELLNAPKNLNRLHLRHTRTPPSALGHDDNRQARTLSPRLSCTFTLSALGWPNPLLPSIISVQVQFVRCPPPTRCVKYQMCRWRSRADLAAAAVCH
jgi:hypothetical protein